MSSDRSSPAGAAARPPGTVPLAGRSPPRTVALALGAALLALGACDSGSDGGGQADAIALTFSPASLSSEFFQGDGTPQLSVDATMSKLPDGSVYVALVQSEQVLDSTVTISVAGTTAHAYLEPWCALAPGVHEGSIEVLLCKDSQCLQRVPLSGNLLPYRFTVSPGPLLTASVDGVPVSGSSSHCTNVSPDVHPGQVVTITSGVPVTWSVGFGYSTGIPTVSDVTTTATTWTGTVGSASGSGFVGSIDVHANPIDTPTVSPFQSMNLDVRVP